MSATKPFFISTKEISLFDSMNEELIDEFVGQSVDIYKINIYHTKNNIYGESTTKYFNVGFRVNCLIRYNHRSRTIRIGWCRCQFHYRNEFSEKQFSQWFIKFLSKLVIYVIGIIIIGKSMV